MEILIKNASVNNFNKTNLLFPYSLSLMKAYFQILRLITYKQLSAMDLILEENGEEKGNKLDTRIINYSYL